MKYEQTHSHTKPYVNVEGLDFDLCSQTIRNLQTSWLQNSQKNSVKKRTNPVLFFIHGFPDDAWCWSNQFSELTQDYSIIAPFLRGHSDSPVEKGSKKNRFGVDASCLDHLEILKSAGFEDRSVVVVGHDLGCVHSFAFAQALGEQCSGLVFIGGLTEWQMKHRISSLRQQFKSWYIYGLLAPGISEAVVKFGGQKLHKWAYSQGGLSAEDMPDTESSRSNLSLSLNQYRSFATKAFFSGQEPKPLSCSTLVIWGNEDTFLVPPNESEFKRYFRGALEFRFLKGNHWIHRENSKNVNKLIRSFSCQSVKKG